MAKRPELYLIYSQGMFVDRIIQYIHKTSADKEGCLLVVNYTYQVYWKSIC